MALLSFWWYCEIIYSNSVTKSTLIKDFLGRKIPWKKRMGPKIPLKIFNFYSVGSILSKQQRQQPNGQTLMEIRVPLASNLSHIVFRDPQSWKMHKNTKNLNFKKFDSDYRSHQTDEHKEAEHEVDEGDGIEEDGRLWQNHAQWATDRDNLGKLFFVEIFGFQFFLLQKRNFYRSLSSACKYT